MKETKQIRRIREMEAKMDEAGEVLKRFQQALADYAAVQETMMDLDEYYGSDWRKDFEAVEAGKLPQDLKRGVLSEDGLYDLLTDNRLAASDALYTIAQLMGQGVL